MGLTIVGGKTVPVRAAAGVAIPGVPCPVHFHSQQISLLLLRAHLKQVGVEDRRLVVEVCCLK